jgi:hypothetical protein
MTEDRASDVQAALAQLDAQVGDQGGVLRRALDQREGAAETRTSKLAYGPRPFFSQDDRRATLFSLGTAPRVRSIVTGRSGRMSPRSGAPRKAGAIMLDRLTDGARDAVSYATELARRNGHGQVLRQHLLVAFAQQDAGVAAEALRSFEPSPDLLGMRLRGPRAGCKRRVHEPLQAAATVRVLELGLRQGTCCWP